MNRLTSEEQEILDAYHDGELERVALSPREIEGYREAARAVSKKSHRVNIRMPAADLRDLKIRALSEGMPYQTLMASVLHKFITGKLTER